MRPFQLSAVLVSAAMLLSGCYVFRGTVDRSQLAHVRSEDEVCHVSSLPMVGDSLLSAFFFTITLAALSAGQSMEGMILGPAISLGSLSLGGLFAADAVSGSNAERDCSDAKEEWRNMKAGHAPHPMKPVAPQPPVTEPQPPAWGTPQPPWGAPQPSEPIPSQPPEN